jgi:acetate kinase
MPPEAYMYGLPLDMCKKDRIRKYGFHGSSHKYVSGVVHNSMKKKSSKTIVCHLGSGSSIAAVKDLESIDTTMGFTPTDGLVMGTRVGSMDPMAIIYMIKQLNMTPTAVEKVLNDKSGFLGMTQMVADLRDVYGLSQKKNVKAVDAMNKFIHQVKSYVGGYTAIMGGVDAIAFTAGIGENAEYIRESVCEGLSQLGVKIDKRKNKKHEFRIDAASSKVKIFVVPTNEELQIARETHEKLEPFIKK